MTDRDNTTRQNADTTAANADAPADTSTGEPSAAQQKAPPADADTWTIMVLLAGDNSLTDECVFALTQMKKVAGIPGVRIFAQFDPRDDYLSTQRYEITNDPKPGALVRDVIGNSHGGRFPEESPAAELKAQARAEADRAAEWAGREAAWGAVSRAVKSRAQSAAGVSRRVFETEVVLLNRGEEEDVDENETDTGSPVTLYNFMSFCVKEAPAKHYMVVCAGHGGGTDRDFLLRDESPRGSLTINELKLAFLELQPELEPGQKIDILGFDTCLMSMAEVCFELRGLVNIMVGCESYSPASGWPYEQILGRLGGLKSDPQGFARAIVEEYVNFYSDYWLGGLSVDKAALNVEEVGNLKTHVDNLATALTRALTDEATREELRRALILAHWEAQSYNGEQYVDLYDFCHTLRKYYQDSTISGLCLDLMKFIKRTFVLQSCFSGPVYQYSHGVSVYFPWSRIAPSYMNLDFSTQSYAEPAADARQTPPPSAAAGTSGEEADGETWLGFLRTYIEVTRRSPHFVEPDELDEEDKDSRESLMSEAFLNLRTSTHLLRQTQGKGPENVVHSMRNPPIIAVPLNSSCIREGKSLQEGVLNLLRE